MTQPSSNPPVLQPRRRQPSRSPLLLLLLLIGAATVGLYFLGRPELVFSNGLTGSVRLAVDANPPRSVGPGESVRVSVPWGRTLAAAWELVRPISADGRPMGEEVRGSIMERAGWGTVRRTAAPRLPDADYFAPLITNASEDLIGVTVNAGLVGALNCGCAVRPGARRVFVGYYRLYRNSTVRAEAKGGRGATFGDLGPQVVSKDGTVGLRFEGKDLRPR